MPHEVALIYAVFPTAGEGHDVVRKLLSERLIACANRLPMAISHFRWEGEIEAREEHPVIFKTSPARAEAAMKRIAQLHRYEVPSVIQLSVTPALPAFADWVAAETV
ncbi:MAG TPA: divalent-cation tolerance protein CutA [Sphingorhabdus sp.]|jgi:periplasmic divalent cation tolerance protein|nr:divalent-cation tolerance protein CutA [Sphingorhabdus sp.]